MEESAHLQISHA